MKRRSADGEVLLPPAWGGCRLVQDPVSQQAVLASLRGSLPTRRPAPPGVLRHVPSQSDLALGPSLFQW